MGAFGLSPVRMMFLPILGLAMHPTAVKITYSLSKFNLTWQGMASCSPVIEGLSIWNCLASVVGDVPLKGPRHMVLCSSKLGEGDANS